MLDKDSRITLAKPHKFTRRFKSAEVEIWIGIEVPRAPKFAVVVPSKFCKAAVARNRTRRLILASLDSLKSRTRPGIYKILAKADFSRFKLDQVLPKIEKLFAEAKLLK